MPFVGKSNNFLFSLRGAPAGSRMRNTAVKPYRTNPISFVAPPKQAPLKISGISRDSTGAVLGGSTVKLFTTIDDVKIAETVSDATTGAYSFMVASNGWGYYTVEYKVGTGGAPDVAGSSENTLTGS